MECHAEYLWAVKTPPWLTLYRGGGVRVCVCFCVYEGGEWWREARVVWYRARNAIYVEYIMTTILAWIKFVVLAQNTTISCSVARLGDCYRILYVQILYNITPSTWNWWSENASKRRLDFNSCRYYMLVWWRYKS